MGHDVEGSFPPIGIELIKKMDQLGMILDVTHLNEPCFWQALEHFSGPIWASHQMCRALVDDVRQFSDRQISALIERGAVLGAAFDVWMVVPGFIRGESTPESIGVGMEQIADHIDHVCQLAGNAQHSGIGSDLDGAYGKEQSPSDLDTIADMQALDGILTRRGYSDEDREAIFHGNFLRTLRQAWS